MQADQPVATRCDADVALAFFEHAPHVCLALSTDGLIRAVNPRGAAMLGFAVGELVGAHVDRLLRTDARQQVASDIDSALRHPGQTIRTALCQVGRDGRLGRVAQELVAPPAEATRRTVFVTWMDVSPPRAAEQALLPERAQARALALDSTLAEERERRRLGIVVHDEIGQRLAVIRLTLERDPTAAVEPRAAVRRTIVLLDEAIAATRRLTAELVSPVLYELGLEAALRGLCQRAAGAHGVPVTFLVRGAARQLRDDWGIVLHRAARELVHNAVKHACATGISVTLRYGKTAAVLIVADDGRGFAAPDGQAGEQPRRGFGLFSLREQVAALGGWLRVDSQPGAGARVEVTAPW